MVRSNRKAQKRPLKESSSSSWLKISRVQDRDWRSTKRYERSNANERPTRPWRLSAKSGSCIVQRPVVDHWFLYWRPYRDWYNEGQSGVSVLTVINTATMFASLCVALLYRTCTLFGCAPMSRTLIELCISTPLLWGVGASPSFSLSRSTLLIYFACLHLERWLKGVRETFFACIELFVISCPCGLLSRD